MRRTTLTAGSLLAATVLTVPLLPAVAAPAADPIARGLVTPLSLAVAPDGTAWVSQNFAGLLTEIPPGGEPEVVFSHPKGAEVGAVSELDGVVTFATTKEKRRAGTIVTALWERDATGEVTKVADLSGYEEEVNPDGETRYGPGGLGRRCLSKLPRGLKPYDGIVESHPYASYSTPEGTYVADAAANAIFWVNTYGAVETVAVMPSVKVRLSRKVVKSFGLPRCLAGHNFRFESVPTDVELGPDGLLYVSSLPGGPEDGSLGANGSVRTVDPATGEVAMLAGDLVSPVGVAVSDTGDVYVSQLFKNEIAMVPAGSSTAERYRFARMPGDVEWTGDAVYATTRVLSDPPKGRVQRWEHAPVR